MKVVHRSRLTGTHNSYNSYTSYTSYTNYKNYTNYKSYSLRAIVLVGSLNSKKQLRYCLNANKSVILRR